MAQRKAHKLEDKERTDDIHIEENVDFAGMYLAEHVLAGLKSAGFERPSPIQLAAIPLGRCGLDLIVQAKSGTGKTCVFTVIALEMISVSAPSTQVLVIAPTREIAVQITQVINAIGSTMPQLRAATFIGGILLNQDKAKLRCCHIAVGTPGRLTQLVELGLLKLENVRLLVLDEADLLLTGQFTKAVVHLASGLPLNKQVLALSATYTVEVAEVVEGLMRSPNHVRLGRDSPALLGVNQFVRLLPYHHQPHRIQQTKLSELQAILATVTFNQCLVFSNSQLRAESICSALRATGWPVSYLTGGQTQCDRLQALEALCSYKCRVLVSTDLSARGLDSEHVNLVINLDMPRDQATYLHRVGRAGRFGSRGGAITLASEGDEWQAIRAIATLANVQIYLLQEDWESSIASKDVKSMEKLELLPDDEVKLWLDNNAQHSYLYGGKKKGKPKKVLEQINAPNGIAESQNKNKVKMTGEFIKDSCKENREVDAVSRNHSQKSKNVRESKEASKKYSHNMKTESKKMNMKTKEQQRRTHQEAASARKEAEDRQREEEVAQNYKTVLKLLEGVSSKSSSVSISYSDILQECSEKYDNISATDNPTVRVPPLPNKLKLTETDLKAFEDHWKTILEEQEQRVINANEMWDCAKFNIHKGLEALIEGKDALTVLNKDDQDEKESRVTNDPSILLTLENDSFSGGESSDNISDRALEVNGSLTYKWHKVKNDAIKEMQHSPNPHSTEISRSNISVNTAPKNKGKKKMLSNSNSPRSSIHSNRQDKEQPRMYMYYDKDMESKEQHMINKQKKDKVHRENKRRASFTGPSGTQAHSGHYDDSSRGHWYYGAQPMNDCHQPRYANNWSWQQHGNANNIQGQQNNYSFQEMNENDPQVGDFGTSRECGNDQPPHQETYGHGNEYTSYWNYNYDSYWQQRSYIESAHKFASMMDYVQHMGRMSAWMAQDFHKRNKENNS